jgi:hypothetical protein
MMKFVIFHMTVSRVGVGAKTRTLKPNPYNGIRVVFEGSSLCLCFSTSKSAKKCPFSTLKLV